MNYIPIFIYKPKPKRKNKKDFFRGELQKEEKKTISLWSVEKYIFFFSIAIAVILGYNLEFFAISKTPYLIAVVFHSASNSFSYLEQQTVNTLPKLNPLPMITAMMSHVSTISIDFINNLQTTLPTLLDNLSHLLLSGITGIQTGLQSLSNNSALIASAIYQTILSVSLACSFGLYSLAQFIIKDSILIGDIIIQSILSSVDFIEKTIVYTTMFVYHSLTTALSFVFELIVKLASLIIWIVTTSILFLIHTAITLITGVFWIITSILGFIVTIIVGIFTAIWNFVATIFLFIKKSIDLTSQAIVAFFQPAVPVVKFIIDGTVKSIQDLSSTIQTTFNLLEEHRVK